MFDDARPARHKAVIWLASPDNGRLSCARCNSEVFSRDVAFYTRTRPGDAFDPWCAACAHQLVRWAGQGALAGDAFDDDEAASRMAELLSHGSF